MRILAIETATAVASVALLEGDRLVREIMESVPRRHLEWLAPSIARILHDAGSRPADVEGVAVSTGPGSFSGLRIGVATAAAWARVRNVPVVACSTLETLAEGLDARGLLCPVLDARRGEVAGALFERNGTLLRLLDDSVGPVQELLARLPRDRAVVFAGDAIAHHGEALRGHPQPVFAPAAQWIPRASMTGRLAWRRLSGGHHDDPYRLKPRYARGAGITLGKGVPPGASAEEMRAAVEEGEGR
ncbi:MAG: tRNA (adenosine(37)-N6)-threonylcarbamoyltransferase complex dimerization subunit type 1 TsaB [bacterium]